MSVEDVLLRVFNHMKSEEKKGRMLVSVSRPAARAAMYTGYSEKYIRSLASKASKKKSKKVYI